MDSSLLKGYNLNQQIEYLIQFDLKTTNTELLWLVDRRSIKRSSRKWEGEGGSHGLTLIN